MDMANTPSNSTRMKRKKNIKQEVYKKNVCELKKTSKMLAEFMCLKNCPLQNSVHSHEISRSVKPD